MDELDKIPGTKVLRVILNRFLGVCHMKVVRIQADLYLHAFTIWYTKVSKRA